MTTTSAVWLRQRVREGPLLTVPGAANALTARVIADLGFEALYVTGAGIANTFLGKPDVGLITLGELTGHVAAIREAVSLPVIVDADTGFGNAIGAQRTVRELERAGADAIQLEDQSAPKKCGHFGGKQVIPLGEMVGKIRAAVDARRRDDTLIVARTDARAVEGFESAIQRALAYHEAGADVLFVEAPRTREELLAVPRRIPAPHVANLVQGGRTPPLPTSQLAEFRIALFANIALQASIAGMQRALGQLRDTGSLSEVHELADWTERQRLVDKAGFDTAEKHYADKEL